MNKNLTELIFILDRSGSMASLEDDTIGGYNSLIKKQRSLPGEAKITTVLFDDSYQIVHDHSDIKKISLLTNREYYARGTTALFDAIGKTVSMVGNRHKFAISSEVPAKTMVVIITDGYENASSEYSLNTVKKMITHQKEKYGWEFLFFGANIDAISTASSFGISADRASSYRADKQGTAINFEAIHTAAKCVRDSSPIDAHWNRKIKEHLKK